MLYTFRNGSVVLVRDTNVMVLEKTKNEGEYSILVDYPVYSGITEQEKMEMGADFIKEALFNDLLDMYQEGNINHFDTIKYLADYYNAPDDMLYSVWCYVTEHKTDANIEEEYGIVSIEHEDDFVQEMDLT